MPRTASTTPNIHMHTTLPQNLAGRLQLHLYSELEGRVPKSAYQEFFTQRLIEFFDQRVLDLSPWTGGREGQFVLRGTPQGIETLRILLDRKETP